MFLYVNLRKKNNSVGFCKLYQAYFKFTLLVYTVYTESKILNILCFTLPEVGCQGYKNYSRSMIIQKIYLAIIISHKKKREITSENNCETTYKFQNS